VRILVGSDLSKASDEAVRQGIALTSSASDELGLCHVLPEAQLRTLFPQEHSRDMEALLELQPRVAEALLAQAERIAGETAPPAEVFIEQGSDYAELVRRAEEWDADLLVIGGHGRSGLGRLFVSSVAEHVVRYAPCSVLVAREGADGAVLVATDLSDPSQSAIEAGAREAARLKRRLVVVHVTETLAARTAPAMALLGANPILETPEIARERRDLASQIISGALERFHAWGEIEIAEGEPTAEILRLVGELPVGLLVVGVRGRSRGARVMLGSVAANLVENAPCSVLAVRVPEE